MATEIPDHADRVGLSFSVEGPGTMIGPYRLLQEIGEGGMGLVYMAEQLEPVRRRVALKLVKAGMDTRHVIARFEAERQALAMMDHPNIAKALDAGATASGRPYFVMELVKGVPITNYCDDFKLSTRARVELFVKVCRAVQHAHQKGIIHRDIKPSNVMVTLHDGEPVPKVIDFGIAKAVSQQLTDMTLFTNYGQMIGTPTYVSPEQAEISGIDVDTRSDIYSLGVLLYELLTGRTPLSQDDVRSATPHELQQMIKEKEPPRPSTVVSIIEKGIGKVEHSRDAESGGLIGLLRGDLDWIVMKCLEKERSRRYETANALAMDLERSLNSVAITARPPSALYKLQKFARRNRALFLAGLTVFAALAIGAVVSTMQAFRARDAEIEAAAQRDHARIAEAAATERAEALAEQIRRNYYINMINAAQAIDSSRVGRFRSIMEAQRSVSAEIDGGELGWEWRYLQGEVNRAEIVMRGHTDVVNACAWSPGGRFLASAGADGRLLLWDDVSGAEVQLLEQSDGGLLSLAWAQDGRHLAAAGEDFSIAIWDVQERARVATFWGHFGGVRSLSWSSNGQRLVSASDDRQLIVWDVGKKGATDSYTAPQGMSAVAWNPDSDAIAYAYNDEQGRVFLWDLESREHRPVRSESYRRGVSSLSWSQDGKLLVAGTNSQDLRIWDLEGGRDLEKRVHPGAIHSVAWHPHEDRIATVGADSVIRLWGLDREDFEAFVEVEPEVVLTGHAGGIRSVSWSAEGSHLITSGDDHSVRRWDPEVAQSGRRLVKKFSSWLTAISWSADGSKVAVCGPELDGVSVYDTQSGELLGQLNEVGRAPTSVIWGPAGSDWMAIGSIGNGMEIWDWPKRRQLRPSIPQASAKLACHSPDGQLILSIVDHRAAIWQPFADGGRLDQLMLPSSRGGGVARVDVADWRAEWLVTGGDDGSVELWDSESRDHCRTLRVSGARVSDIEISPDGAKILIGDREGGLEVYASESGERLYSEKVHEGEVKSLGWRPDTGDRIASAGQDGVIRLIDGSTYEEALQILADDTEMYVMAWSPDGDSILGSGYENSLRKWSAGRPEEYQLDVPTAEPPKSDGIVGMNPRTVLSRLWEGSLPRPDGEVLRIASDTVERLLRGMPSDPYLSGTQALIHKEMGDEAMAMTTISKVLNTADQLPARLKRRLLATRASLWRMKGEFAEAAVDNQAGLGFPPRAPDLSPAQLDLSAFYTERLDTDLHGSVGNNLRSLLEDKAELAQREPVGYDIRGLVHLSCRAATRERRAEGHLDGYPERAEGIPVDRKCKRVFFLHACGWAAEMDGTKVGEIVIHRENGAQDRGPIVFARFFGAMADAPISSERARIWDWWYPDHLPRPAEAVWRGTNQPAIDLERHITLYQFEWTNPTPEIPISRIDYVSSMKESALILAAITVEEVEGAQ